MFDHHLRFSWYARGLLAGSAQPGRFRPLEQDLDELRDRGVRAIISVDNHLTAIPASYRETLAFHAISVPDGYPPSDAQMTKILRIVQSHLDAREPCLVCCRGGIGRTSTILAVLLMICAGMGEKEAREELRSHGRIQESVDQHEFISRWAAKGGKPSPRARRRGK